MDAILECLERSGYLLESKIVRLLTDQGFFVEPNQVVRDPRTGKSREVDLLAEHYDWRSEHAGTCVKTHFVMEMVNNKFPLVLLTPRPSTPNEDFESHVKFIYTPASAPILKSVDVYEIRSPSRERLFSQYCALTCKKGDAKELMASHPDDLYGSFQKLAEYVEDQVSIWDQNQSDSDKYWRLFFWHPMLVLGGQLIAATMNDDGRVCLEEIGSGFLEFNWHAGDERRTTVIEIVSADHLLERLSALVSLDADLESSLHVLRTKTIRK